MQIEHVIVTLVLGSQLITTDGIAQDNVPLTPGDFHQQEWQRLGFLYQQLDEVQPTRNQANIDVIYYRVFTDITDIALQTIQGNTTMTAQSLVDGNLSTELNFSQPMTVDSVIMEGQSCSWNHSLDFINITWVTPIDSGDTFTVTAYYQGHPPSSYFGSFEWGYHSGHSVVWSLSEPTGARDWWACKDIPSDKADSVDVFIRATDTNISTSNGTLREIINPGDGTKTYHWHESYPISTYLISLTSTNFQTISDHYVTLFGDTMPLVHYVYPEDYNDAVIDFSITPSAITSLRHYYGEYPFTNESYGMTAFNWGGAMEHQTLTTYGAPLIQGNHLYDWIVVHELSHQWWGDMVTLSDWPHVWLNEGFASYSEALWKEYNNGLSSYHSYMRNSLTVTDPSGPIYNPNPLFGANTVYHKGAWVLHMLRGVVGDSMWSIFPNYRNHYEYGNASSEDFQHAAEEIWGQDLGWFFQEWLYGVNRPNYRWSWAVGQWGGTNHVFVNIVQQQTNADLFTMPIQFRLTRTGGDTTIVLWDSLANQTFSFVMPSAPNNAALDPDQWILRYQQQVAYPLTIATENLLMASLGSSYQDTLHGIGGTAPYRWRITTGALPEGLVLDSLTGVISGIPDTSGSFLFAVTLADNAGGNTTREFALQILGLPEMVHDVVIQRLGNDIILGWGRSENATGYTIYRTDILDLPWDSLTTVSDTIYIDTGILETLNRGFYQVTARRD